MTARCGTPQTLIGTGASRHVLTAIRRPGDQQATGPQGVAAQSIEPQRSLISPGPAKNESDLVVCWTFATMHLRPNCRGGYSGLRRLLSYGGHSLRRPPGNHREARATARPESAHCVLFVDANSSAN